ncbi:hypothetical protein DVH24_038790 [Malus domestica]|uniref:tRNA-intron lyase n=1 Tax=Malus domestica TaxID=3750 RepID=A0A498KAZ0_MALDO|nr:hypothetical protein DVH24_038790 [Malus domestica]
MDASFTVDREVEILNSGGKQGGPRWKGKGAEAKALANPICSGNRAYFGHLIVNADKDKHWFQLGMEEAFFLCYTLKCLKIAGEHKHPKDDNELWQYMTSQKAAFPVFYKAYSHLRTKNWVVRPGHQYGEDFVAYRHLPSLVHSEYAVLVSSE